MNDKPTTWYKTETITCSSCGDKSGYPIAKEWWRKHISAWHTFKYWLKRRLHQ